MMIAASALTAAVRKVQLTAPLATVGMVRPAKMRAAATPATAITSRIENQAPKLEFQPLVDALKPPKLAPYQGRKLSTSMSTPAPITTRSLLPTLRPAMTAIAL